MTMPSEPRKKTGGRWMRILLFVSLAFNLLIVGLIGGAMLRHAPARSAAETPSALLRQLGYGPFGLALSPEDRREIGRAMQGRAGEIRANRDAMNDQLASFLEAVRRSPYDAQALRVIVGHQQAKLNERQEIGQQVLLERIDAMSDDDRAAFAGRLERILKRTMRRNR